MRLGAVLLALAAPALCAPKWRIQYFYDQAQSELQIRDLSCPSSRRCTAVGNILDKRRSRPVSLVTSDEGANWATVPLEEAPVSLFFRDETKGWLVTEKGIWSSAEAGRSWNRIKSIRGLHHVYFLDDQRGFAVGAPRLVLETGDGGRHWENVNAASRPPSDPSVTTYHLIDFAADNGIIAGAAASWRSASDLPGWIDPERAARNRAWPSLLIFLNTGDRGKTWLVKTATVSAELARIRVIPNRSALAIFETGGREPLSELYRFDLPLKNFKSIYQRKDLILTDIFVTPDNQVFLAGVERAGRLIENPVPSKLHVLRSQGLESWTEMEVDYRIVARNAVFSGVDAEHLHIATDTGMILGIR